MKRRDFLRNLAVSAPVSQALGSFQAMAEPTRHKVKITDLKAAVYGQPGGNTLARIDTDAGVSGYGEAYWGFGVKDVIRAVAPSPTTPPATPRPSLSSNTR